MRKIDLIIIHCSATRADSDFSAQDVDTAHRYRGLFIVGVSLLYPKVGTGGADEAGRCAWGAKNNIRLIVAVKESIVFNLYSALTDKTCEEI